MSVSLDYSPRNSFNKVSKICSTSPSSYKRFWSSLRDRVDTLLENRDSTDTQKSGEFHGVKTDSLLLLKGFDSVSHSLSQLSKNLDHALQGAKDLAKAPTLTDIYERAIEQAKSNKTEVEKDVKEEEKYENGDSKRGLKRKIEEEEGDSQIEQDKPPKDKEKFKKAKNLAVSMTTKAASLARELKLLKSEMYFMQQNCNLLEEENRRLRDGFSQGIIPDEDDLVRLQLETLLAEKSRLANVNANLTRENQCLTQLVKYHQIASYENVIQEEEGEDDVPT